MFLNLEDDFFSLLQRASDVPIQVINQPYSEKQESSNWCNSLVLQSQFPQPCHWPSILPVLWDTTLTVPQCAKTPPTDMFFALAV